MAKIYNLNDEKTKRSVDLATAEFEKNLNEYYNHLSEEERIEHTKTMKKIQRFLKLLREKEDNGNNV